MLRMLAGCVHCYDNDGDDRDDLDDNDGLMSTSTPLVVAACKGLKVKNVDGDDDPGGDGDWSDNFDGDDDDDVAQMYSKRHMKYVENW